MICLTRIPRAALEDVRLAGYTLLMPMNDDSIQWRRTPRASLLVGIGWDEGVIHLDHGMKLPILNRIICSNSCDRLRAIATDRSGLVIVTPNRSSLSPHFCA